MSSSSVKRACDACHRRKVKCDGITLVSPPPSSSSSSSSSLSPPCRNCSTASLGCTYLAVPQKKGPKGSRAKVISELRETQRLTTLSSKVASRIQGIINSPPCSPTLSPTPGLLTAEMIKECMNFFFAHMYPTMPILHRGRLEQQAVYVDQNVDTYCLLTSLCAFMMIQPGMGIPGDPLGLDSLPGANLVSGTMLMEETLRVRKSYDHLESPTLNSLVTSYFLYGSYFGLDLHNKAWFHLREATTLAHILGMQKEDTYLQLDQIEASRRRRLYWLLFTTERSYALQRHRPLSLPATISLPTQNDDPSDLQSHNLHGFIHMVSLFRPFDDQFVALWNKTRTDCSPSYLATLQKQLTDALPAYLNSTDNQTADLRTSQQWLRTMVWQLSIQNGCLSSGSEDPAMTFQYPVEIARDLLSMASQFSPQSMEIHGIALIEKLFDVACSLTDVLSLLPAHSDPFTLGPRDYLHQFMTLLSLLRSGDNRFLPLLLAKVHDVLPKLTNPMLQTVPDNSPSMGTEVDIFDGFGSAGMGLPSNFTGGVHTTHAPEFKIENPAITPFDRRYEDLRSPSIPESNEPHTPFTSPPILASPMEYPGLGEYTGFPDLSGPRIHNGIGHNSPVIGEFKREFGENLASRRPPPVRQGSGGSFGLQIPRSVPEFHHLHRTTSGGEGDVGMNRPNDLAFR
ncbi:hypothetical protein B7494_g5901 [Chlorociboria aeruginascens]|nr:hypothetical protein B7494_g5901 [Chlorociboria aeruginascens]